MPYPTTTRAPYPVRFYINVHIYCMSVMLFMRTGIPNLQLCLSQTNPPPIPGQCAYPKQG